MKNLESFSESGLEVGYDPFLEKLWRKNKFMGKPPPAGSVAEQRLKEACNSYVNLVNDPNIYNPRLNEDSENYFAKTKTINYDSRRRELHNMIALMVVGEQRSGMNESLATKIANFAIEYISEK